MDYSTNKLQHLRPIKGLFKEKVFISFSLVISYLAAKTLVTLT